MEAQQSSSLSNSVFDRLRQAILDNDDDDDDAPVVSEALVARLFAAISNRLETSAYFDQNRKDTSENNQTNSVLLSQQLFRSLLQRDDGQQQNEDAAKVREAIHVVQPQIWNIQPPLTVLLWILEKWYQTGKFPLLEEERKQHTYVVPGATTIFKATTNNAPAASSSSSSSRAEQKKTVLQAYQEVRSAIIPDGDYDEETEECIQDFGLLDEHIHRLLTALHSYQDNGGGGGGIPSWLGHRLTVGTIQDRLCPPITMLLQSFQQLHAPDRQSVLTVGGRALTKHYSRHQQKNDDDDDDNDEKRSHHPFWPQPVGNCAHKNALAWHTLVHDILNHAVWINVHVVPSGGGEQLPVVEIRQEQGYGARWSADGKAFRGFLEPVSPFYEEDDIT